ncbi:2-C-methyl-D-erythritol 2,4-cyclodiphosphate synthase [Planctomicrobium sp. SH664]|uniref:2-C-methyl-D-erythritol 2,4-cyclodiphosphate synthase n=1 Tax=Planctomicrobium sp. SH664 TaxID=3448125 RepID=UPI003F5B8861
MTLRIGLGHDTHRLQPGGPLTIGGVVVPHEQGFVAHSDGDVLLHALIDAILGALAWGDIGEWFPDTAPEFRGADSTKLLEKVLERVRAEGWEFVNVDSILFAQRPKLSPYKDPIRLRVAGLLGIPVSQVNVKAKTGERVGPIGREEAISAEVVVLLNRSAHVG